MGWGEVGGVVEGEGCLGRYPRGLFSLDEGGAEWVV